MNSPKKDRNVVKITCSEQPDDTVPQIITDRTQLPLYPATYYQQRQLVASVSNPVFLFNIQNSNYHITSGKIIGRLFVRMPYDQLGTSNMERGTGPMWNSIQDELTKVLEELNSPNADMEKIIRAIEQYNPAGSKECNFSILKSYLQLGTSDTIQNNLKSMQHVIKHALDLPKIIPHPIPLLQKGDNKTIVMTQQQVLSLLANAFLCTFGLEPKNYPEINFFRLHSSSTGKRTSNSMGNDQSKLEKLKCIFTYFYQMYLRNNFELWSHGKVVTFERRCLADFEIPDWKQSYKTLSDVEININGKIEDCGKEMLQVDFANQFVGGGIFNENASMEEIRFSICPELKISRLFTEKLSDEEVLIVTGCEQFSQYEGYGGYFKCTGGYDDPANIDSMGRVATEVVAMDPLKFYPNRKWEQFSMRNINRELNKCFTAFMLRSPTAPKTPIASGNWGCGALNGDPELKFLIQWMAASQAERKFVMFVFTQHEQANSIEDIVIFLKRNRVTVKTLYRLLEVCSSEIMREQYRGPKLFHLIQHDVRCLKIIRGDSDALGNEPEHVGSRAHSKGRNNWIRPQNKRRTRRKQQEICSCS